MQNPTYRICNGVHFVFRGIKSDAQNSNTMNRSFSLQRYIHCKSLIGYMGKKNHSNRKMFKLASPVSGRNCAGEDCKAKPKVHSDKCKKEVPYHHGDIAVSVALSKQRWIVTSGLPWFLLPDYGLQLLKDEGLLYGWYLLPFCGVLDALGHVK